MPEAHKTVFRPNPVQKLFIESRHKADLFSSRMGEGKSTAMAWSALYHTKHNPGATWAIIRDTWENLQHTTLKTFLEWFPQGVYGEFHQGRKTYTWYEGAAKGEVQFFGMDAPEDASKLMSRELAGFAIDEPAPAVGSAGVDELIFDIALTRLRQQGMQWYGAKLAVNNPDETHWVYKRFVSPGEEGFALWQPSIPENEVNLPSDYYQTLRKVLGHRPDLIRRFVEGEFGFQQEGRAVTPQWSDKQHLALGLVPEKGRELVCLWDFGHNPTFIVTQISARGHWNILDALVGEQMGTEELIESEIVPLLQERYKGFSLRHTGDPTGGTGDQSSIRRSPVQLIRKRLGGLWVPGPVKIPQRIEPLRSVLSRSIGGTAVVQVDRKRAARVWHALRGGWKYHVARSGLVSGQPVKDEHSHPGDAMGYGAALLFPLGRLSKGVITPTPAEASFFGSGGRGFLGQPGRRQPAHGEVLR